MGQNRTPFSGTSIGGEVHTDISGELALVTGAGSGIGKAVATRLASLGCDVILVGRTVSKLEQTAAEVRARGAQAHCMPCDLTDADAIVRLAQRVRRECGRLDILVNNAGVMVRKRLEDTTTAELDAILATNVRAPFILCRELLPLLLESNAAEIVNVCSVVAHEGYPMQAAYAASKHALLGMSKSLANEVYERGVRVHVVSPGGVRTDMVGEARPDLAGVPMIEPDDMADAVEYLLTHRSDAVVDEIRLHRSTKAPF